MRKVVITGIGVISPIGIGVKAFWENLLAGKIGVRKIASFDASGFPSQIAGEVPPYKIGDYVPKHYRKATKVMARDIELAVVAADDAFKDAGLKSAAYGETGDFDGKRFGCNIGAGLISVDLNELTGAMHTARDGNRLDLRQWGKHGMEQLTPLWLLKYLPNMLACHVTIIHQLKGPSNTITCADASSHLAIGEAFRTIQRGDADLAICGGAETKVQPMGLMRQCLLHRVTEMHNDSPESAVRPFDAAATGTAVGEGGGLFILEEFEHARKSGRANLRRACWIRCDTGHLQNHRSLSHRRKLRQGDRSVRWPTPTFRRPASIFSCRADWGLPATIGLSSTVCTRFSAADCHGWRCVRSNRAPAISPPAAVSTPRRRCWRCTHGKIPAALNSEKPVGDLKLNLSQQPRDAKINVAVSSVYSLGGQNAALVFKGVPS